MNSEVRDAIKVMEGWASPVKVTNVVGVPDPKVEGCVLIGWKNEKKAFLVYTDKHFDEMMRGDFEEVDWNRASVIFERWEAGLDGEALFSNLS